MRYQLDGAQLPLITADSEHVMHPALQALPNQPRMIWLEITDRRGNILWRNDAVGTTNKGDARGLAWMSDDARRVRLAYGERASFLKSR